MDPKKQNKPESVATMQHQPADLANLPWNLRRRLTQDFVLKQLFDPARREDETYEAYKARRKLAKKAESKMLRGTPINGL